MKIGRFFKSKEKSEGTGSVFQGMLTMALGSGSARLVSIAAIPILSRIYTPSDYGVLAVFTSLTTIIAPLLALRYGVALPLPKRDSMAINLLALCLILMLLTSSLFSVSLWIFGEKLLNIMSMETLLPYRWLIIICFIGTAIYEIMTSWSLRRKAYNYVAKTQFTQSAFGALTKVILGFMSIKPLGLLIGQTIGLAAGSGSLFRRHKDDYISNIKYISARNMMRSMRYYWRYPVFQLPSQLFQNLSMRLPMLFVAARFDPSSTGQFGMAVMSLSIPMNIFGRTLGRAFLAETAAIGRNNPAKIERLTYSVFKRILPISLSIGVTIYFLSPWVFSTFLGNSWQTAGQIGSAMSFYVSTQLLSAPLMNLLSVLSKNGVHLIFNCTQFFLVVFAFIFSYFAALDLLSTILLYSLSLSIQRCAQAITILVLLRRERTKRDGVGI